MRLPQETKNQNTGENTVVISNEARQIAYQSGVAALAPLTQRVIDLEKAVAELQAALAAKQ
jgi:hypothetical protein